ncbi:ARID/BRIGHT DNA-binding domain [Macleaya cordata]|uniref:ARID/BRIGHT DNA-binding domain n=1 Tax=Macleaya cordata TaxID=56857 RepID=A0A200QU58_MACCD|nr:ARID/BRIGHT DNA-binding domain [Macleaya cordata]
MAGWSILTDGFAFDYFEIIRDLQKNGFCIDIDVDESSMKVSCLNDDKYSKLRCWFDQILSVYLKEISQSEIIRPLPAMLGNGQVLDLFRLFSVVREKGGYNLVTKNGLWGSVADESGLCSEVASSVKLLYIKYLDTLDKWVRKICREKGIGESLDLADSIEKLCSLLVGLDSEFKDFLRELSDHRKVFEESDQIRSDENELQLIVIGDNDKKCVDDDEDVEILDPSAVNVDLFSRKRKRETLSEMLNWVTEIAKDPGDSAILKLAEVSMKKVNGGLELKDLALLARKVLFHRKVGYLNAENSLAQKKQKIHPSIYEDQIANNQSRELRCSERLHSLKTFQSHSESSVTSQNDLDTSLTPSNTGMRLVVIADSINADIVDPFDEDQREKHVPIGPLFQAEVPEWTGKASESDSKWLGKQHWPLITENKTSLIESDSIGKGRQDSCFCQLPGSVECVRFHIAEAKLKLKLELGLAFYNWRFHFMGEEVSLSWTKEEEKKFKAIVKLNPPSLEKCFWDEALRCFRNKKRKTLVSYYFNVFLLRRRCYQNRVTPDNIDSDDDESELGYVSNGFGHQEVKVSGSGLAFNRLSNPCICLD